MKKVKVTVVGLVVFFVIIGAVLLWRGHTQKSTENKQTNKYSTEKAEKVTALTLSGRVSPKEQRSFSVTKKNLATMKVEDGQQVTSGQVLYTTYNQTNATQLAELKTTLAKEQREKTEATQKLQTAKNTLSKLQKSDDGYTDAQNDVTSASDSLDDANDSISSTQTKINQVSDEVSPSATAPFAGNVTITYDNSGNAKVTVASTDLQVIAQVSEYDYAKVKTEASVSVKAVATGKKQDTIVTLVSLHPTSTNSAAGSKYNVYADLDGSKFIDGQTVKVTVPQSGVVISKSSVYHGKVYVVKNNKIVGQKVSGKNEDGTYVVKTGLTAGQKVITNPDNKLKTGEKWPQ